MHGKCAQREHDFSTDRFYRKYLYHARVSDTASGRNDTAVKLRKLSEVALHDGAIVVQHAGSVQRADMRQEFVE